MQNQRTRERIEALESTPMSRRERAAVIGLMILFALLAVMAAVAIDTQARL